MSEIKKQIKKNPMQAVGLGITIAITLANVVIGYFLLTISHNLAPLEKNIAVLGAELQSNTDTDKTEHAKFVTFETFNAVVTRLDHISNRVDTIYSIIVKK